MWLLITFIIVWALSPGPVFVMTMHETRKHGASAGIAVSGGATLTSILMVVAALLIHSAGFSAILETGGMFVIERIGAFGIILMGLYAGYRCLASTSLDVSASEREPTARYGFAQGMMVMATYIPQALLYYNVIVPQTVGPDAIVTAIVVTGALKVITIFGWHTGIALMTARAQKWVNGHRFGKAFEFASAGLIMIMGVNILF